MKRITSGSASRPARLPASATVNRRSTSRSVSRKTCITESFRRQCNATRRTPYYAADRDFLAGDNDGSVASCCREAGNVAGVAGQDAVAGGGEEHDGRVDRIGCSRGTQQGTGLTAVTL